MLEYGRRFQCLKSWLEVMTCLYYFLAPPPPHTSTSDRASASVISQGNAEWPSTSDCLVRLHHHAHSLPLSLLLPLLPLPLPVPPLHAEGVFECTARCMLLTSTLKDIYWCTLSILYSYSLRVLFVLVWLEGYTVLQIIQENRLPQFTSWGSVLLVCLKGWGNSKTPTTNDSLNVCRLHSSFWSWKAFISVIYLLVCVCMITECQCCILGINIF